MKYRQAGNTKIFLLVGALVVIAGIGLFLVIASAAHLGTRSYSTSTRPRADNVFVHRGIYGYLRHPIYTGILILSLSIFLSRPTLVSGAAYLLLVLITNVRAGIEEQMLEERYPEYLEYRRCTKRYIPFIV